MRIKVYRAASIRGAIALMRDELGPDALLLSSRGIDGGVEVTGALEPEEEEGRADDLERVDLSSEPGPERGANAGPPGNMWAGSDWADRLAWQNLPVALLQRLTPRTTSERLETVCARSFRYAALDLATGAPPLLMAGPPGAGKTLAVARLATRLVLQGQSPVVVTTDGQRAGAAEQLAAFTRLLGLTLVVAEQPSTVQRMLARREAGTPVLIDLPALDPFDTESRDRLVSLTEAAAGELVLVLPTGIDAFEAADLAQAHAALGARRLLATRLDLSPRLGGILWAAESAVLALTEAGTGPGVADGLSPITPALVADYLQRRRAMADAKRPLVQPLAPDDERDARLPAPCVVPPIVSPALAKDPPHRVAAPHTPTGSHSTVLAAHAAAQRSRT